MKKNKTHREIHSPDTRLSLFFNDQGETLRFFETLPTGEEIDYFFPREGSSNPMMHPWCNRVKNGTFSYEGQEFLLRPLHGRENNALHGNWQAPWKVESQNLHTTILTLDCQAQDGKNDDHRFSPYSYGVRQILTLDNHGLNVQMTLTNHGITLPFGIGLHPFLPRPQDTILKIVTSTLENCDADMIPDEGRPVIDIPEHWTLATGFNISDKNLSPSSQGFGKSDLMDNCFPDVDPLAGAEIQWPSFSDGGRQMAITASANCRFAVCFVPGAANDVPVGEMSFFCFELTTNGINMQNRLHDNAGAKILCQGEVMQAVTSYNISKLKL